MKIAHIMLLNIKTFLYNTKKAFILSRENRHPTLMTHITVPEGPPSLTPYTKANIRDGYVIPQESELYHKSEKYELFRKQNWFGAVHPNFKSRRNSIT